MRALSILHRLMLKCNLSRATLDSIVLHPVHFVHEHDGRASALYAKTEADLRQTCGRDRPAACMPEQLGNSIKNI